MIVFCFFLLAWFFVILYFDSFLHLHFYSCIPSPYKNRISIHLIRFSIFWCVFKKKKKNGQTRTKQKKSKKNSHFFPFHSILYNSDSNEFSRLDFSSFFLTLFFWPYRIEKQNKKGKEKEILDDEKKTHTGNEISNVRYMILMMITMNLVLLSSIFLLFFFWFTFFQASNTNATNNNSIRMIILIMMMTMMMMIFICISLN